ncbi:tetratricopeptide repeat protein 7b [Plakobranchus ocellatus]|uniref:Tetratricopeptide repeat protein 7b n=1 Tax=Plakobranchus ocellatus TaxID=259542 RepID=A0AAV3ZX29_9GAST|nr:tetratricopeptide repeat protein 7b [Plakobranchus ocellatus]
MTSKAKTQRLEAEIDKYRSESNWRKSLDLAKQWAPKSTEFAMTVTFLQGEMNLEEFLEIHDPTQEDHIFAARSELTDANEYLSKVAASPSPHSIQASLLLAKIQFCQGFYQVALSTLDQHDLSALAMRESEANSWRNTRLLYIVAESYAIRGKCLEKGKTSLKTKFKAAERDSEIIACYETAGDLALLCLQQRDKFLTAQQGTGLQMTDPASNFVVTPLIEMAIAEVPYMHLQRGEETKCITRYREMLRAVESRFSQDIRKTLALELAQLLLKSCSVKSYPQIDLDAKGLNVQAPKPCVYSSEKLFVPKTLDEEVLLLLLIAEAVGTKEAVLERSKETQELTFLNVTAIYDLLALMLVKRAQFGRLTESFEKAMRFSYQEFHIWYQFANSLISSGKYAQAEQVLGECHMLAPKNASVCLQAAQLCYEHLQTYNKGMEWAKLVIQFSSPSTPKHVMARAYMAKGIGLCLVAKDSKLLADRQKMDQEALQFFKKAHDLDPKDYLCAFHLGLQCANMRRIQEAMSYIKLSLKHRSDFIHSLHLLALLLSARKQHGEAMDLVLAALEEYPDNLSLLMTKAKLQKIVQGPEEALSTYKMMLKLWKDLHELDVEEGLDPQCKIVDRSLWEKRSNVVTTLSEFNERGSDPQCKIADRSLWEKRSNVVTTLSEFNERGSGSIRAESMAASRVEKALSDLASSMNSSFQPRVGPQRSWIIQAQIWLNLAELYLSLNQVNEAQSCALETFNLFPHSVFVFFLRGLVLEHRGYWTEAKVCFENAVAVNPAHTKSLYHLGIVLHKLGDNRLAEKTLRDAVNLDPCFHKAWFMLGTVLEAVGEPDDASNCLITGSLLEATCPVAPFNVIQRVMR